MSKENIYSPNKGKNFYSVKEILNKIFFTFKKKRKIFYELLYLTFAIKLYHKISAKIIIFFVKRFGFDFYNNNKILRLLFFSGIRGMSLEQIFDIREAHIVKIKKNDEKVLDNNYKIIISELRDKGFCDISEIFNLNENDADNVKKFFKSKKLYNGHDPLQSDLKKIDYSNIYNDKTKHEIFNKGYFSFDVETSLENQLINNLFKSNKLKKIADLYCGFETEPYTISTMLNVKKEILHPVTSFHRDTDDFISLGFFIYWSKTDKNNGATKYKVGSHRKYNNNDSEFILEANPGTMIAGDWMGLHSGNQKMEDRERLITMIRFGKKINQSYMQTKSYYFF